MQPGADENRRSQEPPSFMPSGHGRQHLRQGGPIPQPSQTPPSFSPSSRSNRNPSSDTPQGRKETRRTAGSSKAAPKATKPVMQPPRNTPNMVPRPGRGGSGTLAAKPHHRLRIVTTILIILILLLLVLAGGSWFWINAKLNHKPMLTESSGSPASTWLILGSDERDGTPGAGQDDEITGFRTDTILILTKPRHGAASLISVPRDSLVMQDGQNMKINALAYSSGYTSLTSHIETIIGHKVDHVAVIQFGGLQGLVDALGGIELCYEADVNDPNSGMVWSSGCHHADGGTALAFSRMRYSDPKGDFGRAERQRQVIGAITKKALQPSVMLNPSSANKVISTGLNAIVVDERTNAWTLARMMFAFRDATGGEGITGSLYWTDPDYYPGGIGSTVLLDEARNTNLFQELVQGTHAPGQVGGM